MCISVIMCRCCRRSCLVAVCYPLVSCCSGLFRCSLLAMVSFRRLVVHVAVLLHCVMLYHGIVYQAMLQYSTLHDMVMYYSLVELPGLAPRGGQGVRLPASRNSRAPLCAGQVHEYNNNNNNNNSNDSKNNTTNK